MAVLIVNFCATFCLYYLLILIVKNRKCNKIDSDLVIFGTKQQTICTRITFLSTVSSYRVIYDFVSRIAD